jgi:hypothetical protein
MGVCRIAPSCPEPASVADHIIPVHPGMADDLFFGLGNLRAACKRHNTARGVAARLERETRGNAGPSQVVTTDYSRKDGDDAA